ncbi:unnamed protein product [Hermetia illucens]|uniref:Lysosomal acid phosphatase n=2 Tax=Hermetia illucens TaxID=343691 RepID=A0A7R8UP60_HERIL|nr:unnamed protein product [Hermetia illucens]
MMAYMVFGDNNDEEGLRTLRMISIIFRHGNRTPTDFYPNDPYLLYDWPGGQGALTETGALQMYNLGKTLRMRYYRLLPTNGLYSKDEMHILSSAAERCLMSASSLLAGFLPPLESRNILPIPWQPVPVNLIPRDRDFLLAQKKPCPTYDEILGKLYSNPPPDLKKLNEKSAELYRFLTKNTGKNISNIREVELLFNTLAIEQDAGLTLPAWTESVFPDKMLPLAERNYVLHTETSLMKKIKGGPLITTIYRNMTRKRGKKLQPDRKVFLYSAHDVTLVNVMNSLGILDQTAARPDYASALVFEMHHSNYYKDDFEVKIVYYFNSEDKFPKELRIPNCDSPCSLTNFGRSIEHLLVDDYDEICGAIS